MKWLVLFLCLFGLVSCDTSGETPCDWEQSKFYATVNSIEFKSENNDGDSTFVVWVEFSSGSLSSEVQNLGELRNTEFTRARIKRNQAYIGNSFTGLISETADENCNSPIISFDQKLR